MLPFMPPFMVAAGFALVALVLMGLDDADGEDKRSQGDGTLDEDSDLDSSRLRRRQGTVRLAR